MSSKHDKIVSDFLDGLGEITFNHAGTYKFTLADYMSASVRLSKKFEK